MKPEKADYKPKCPFCEKEIETVGLHTREPASFVEKTLGMTNTLAVFSCPECHKVLGTTQQPWSETR